METSDQQSTDPRVVTGRHAPFRAEVRVEPDLTLLVELHGELDLYTGSILEESLRPFMGVAEEVSYDLSNLGFLDASGIHSLLDSCCGIDQDSIRVHNPPPIVRRLLELVDLAGIID